jgi:hypothetical protein
MADEIIRLDYSAEDIGDNIDEVRTARGEYDSLDERLDEIEGGGPSPSNPIASNCVSPMTGYSKSSSSTPGNISTSDTLNAAIGKLEKRTELNENNILLLDKYGGGRNVLSVSQVTTSSSVVNIETIPAGTYKFHCDTDAPSNWALKFRNASNTDVYVVESAGSMGPNSAITVTLTEDVVKVSPWWQGTSSGLKNMYLCRETDWTTPYVYQPYAMSNEQITAWILAHS